jgi:glutathionylspermidine synthase
MLMKKILLLLCLVLNLSGCVYQAELRPEYNDTDVWVCETPHIELCWSKSSSRTGVICSDDTQYNIIHEQTYGPLIWVYTDDAKPIRNTDIPKDLWIFKGHVNYGKDALTIEVQEDFKNIFNGEKPTLEFKRYDKEEYLKNKEK